MTVEELRRSLDGVAYVLSNLVEDAKLEEAQAIQEEGTDAELAYLLSTGMTPEQIWDGVVEFLESEELCGC